MTAERAVLDGRWRRVGLVAAAVAAVLVVAGVGVALSGAFGADRALVAHERAAPLQPLVQPLPAPTTVPGPPACRSPLTPADPLRLWIAGDSLAGSLGPALGRLAGNTGVVTPVFDSRVSSGLANPGFFDWPRHATKELSRLDPEVVVFIIGANDWSTPSNLPIDDKGEPAWRGRYATAVDEMLEIMLADDRRVFWVSAPVMQDSGKDRGVRQVNEVARARVEQHPNAVFVDAYKLFADENGRYTATVLNAADKRVRVRTDDGVHFTADGAEVIGSEAFRALDERCRLTAQAVPTAARPVTQAPGSGGGGTASVNGAIPTTSTTATTLTSLTTTTTGGSATTTTASTGTTSTTTSQTTTTVRSAGG